MKAAFDRAREALNFLESHQLDPVPVYYALALAHVSDPTGELSRDIARRTDGGIRLTSEEAAELAERHLDHAIGQRERTMARQTATLGNLTSDAHDLTSALGRDVEEIAGRADDLPAATEDFVERLSQAERELAEMRGAIAQLKDQIASGDRRTPDGDRDTLTQALNQGGARQMLDAIAIQDRDYTLLLFLLDDLVALNERYGRGVGDNVVNALAATLRQVFPHNELIRWSGNEFVVVLPDIAPSAARALATEALAALESRRLRLRGSGEWIGVVTASAGLAIGGKDSLPDVMAEARTRATAASQQGGNTVAG